MPVPENEILAARLARMKTLLDTLEKACSESAEQREMFLKLQQEMADARAALKTYPSPSE